VKCSAVAAWRIITGRAIATPFSSIFKRTDFTLWTNIIRLKVFIRTCWAASYTQAIRPNNLKWGGLVQTACFTCAIRHNSVSPHRELLPARQSRCILLTPTRKQL